MTAYFIDRDEALAKRIFPDFEHRAFWRVDNDMTVWQVFADGREERITIFTLSDLRNDESIEEISRLDALARVKVPEPPRPADPDADRPRTSPPTDAW